jgi:dUTP pyrophosphatase
MDNLTPLQKMQYIAEIEEKYPDIDKVEIKELTIKCFQYTGPVLKKATPGSAGFDLISMNTIQVEPGRIAIVSTGTFIKPPQGYYFEVFIRSSWGKKGLSLANGVGIIDSDYRGEVILAIRNCTNEVITIQARERIAQMIPKTLEPLAGVYFCKEDFDLMVAKEAGYNMRGTGGFGSTGN